MKRYLIILTVVALGLLSCQKEEQAGGGNDKPSGKANVTGCVKGSDGRCLEGVVVSDGHLCVKTDADGCFEFCSDLKNTKFIMVSTPEQYSAPVKNGLPVFFKRMEELKMDKDSVYRNVDFTLDKIAGNPDRFTIFFSADPQPRSSSATYDNFAYHALDCCEDLYRDWREKSATITDRPVYGVVLGDIVHENMTLFKNYAAALAKNSFPTYNVLGNHDHDLDRVGSTGGDNMIGSQTFEATLGPANYSANLGKIHLVVMDDMYVPYKNGKCPKGDYITGFTDRDWEWLRNDLSFVDRSTPVFFCAHGVIYTNTGGTEMGTRTNNHLSDVAHLIAKFKGSHAWFGHSHNCYNHVYADNDKNFPGMESHIVPRSTGELWTNERLAGGVPRGYVVVDVDGTDVKWVFRPVAYESGSYCGKNHGRPDLPYMNYTFTDGVARMKDSGDILDEKYQISAYPPGAFPEYDADGKYVFANVYFWDKKWGTPKFTLDGGSSATMNAFTNAAYLYDATDRAMGEFYIKNESSTLGKNGYSYNKEVRTLFRTYVPQEKGSGTISVTDRFGNEYSTHISW